MQLIDLTGRYNIARAPLAWGYVNGGAWHHTVTRTPTPSWTQDQEIAVLDAIDRYHRQAQWRNWQGELVSLGGFAYHLAVFPSRRAYLVTPLVQRGAHVANHNGHLVAVVLIGTFTDTAPVAAQLETAAAAGAYAERERRKTLTWKGHRQWADPGYETACPGDTHASWVPQLSIRQEVRTVYTDKQIDAWIAKLGGQIAGLDSRLRKLERRPAPAPAPKARYYTVRSGDVAGLIAQRHGLSWERFKRLNPKGPRSGRWRLIRPGEKFRVA